MHTKDNINTDVSEIIIFAAMNTFVLKNVTKPCCAAIACSLFTFS